MAKDRETRQELTIERERRGRLAVPVCAGGVLYLLGSIAIANQLQGLPTVGLIQGLEPALMGKARAVESPRAAEVRYLSHHAFGLIAGGVLQAIGFAALTLALLFLLLATRFRAPEPSPVARMLVLIGGAGAAAMTIVSQVVRAIRTHEFLVGHNFSDHAVEKAIYTGPANVTVEFLTLLLPFLLVVGMVMALLRATRVGLIQRWLRTVGIVAAVLLLPFFSATLYTLQIVPAGWMVALGFLFMGRLPSGDPPAWASGEAVPWPAPGGRAAADERSASAGELNGKGGSATGERRANEDGDGDEALDDDGESGAPMASAASSASRRRRRKRGGRR
jgi:hypothetical protein